MAHPAGRSTRADDWFTLADVADQEAFRRELAQEWADADARAAEQQEARAA